MSDERRAEVIEKVRDILVSDWDPIDVGSNPNLRDEYDAAVGPILQALAKPTSARELSELLAYWEREFLNMEGEAVRRERAVVKLLALKESLG